MLVALIKLSDRVDWCEREGPRSAPLTDWERKHEFVIPKEEPEVEPEILSLDFLLMFDLCLSGCFPLFHGGIQTGSRDRDG